MSGPNFSAEDFQADVLDHLEAQPVEPGKFQAVNWKALIRNVDGLIQKAAPVIETLSPPQYAAMVELVAQVVHSFSGGESAPAA